HPALVTPELFEACRRRREENRENYSSPRGGLKGNVWPLAGQMRCGHRGQPAWTMPVGDEGGKRKGGYGGRARGACSRRRTGGRGACPPAGLAPYAEALGRVITVLQEKLAAPGVVAELTRELGRQLRDRARSGQADRRRLTARLKELDGKVAEATANLAHV